MENCPEQRTPVDLAIKGTIPPWLSGALYRTGPGTFRVATTADPSKMVDIQHWFDGLAMHHRFEIHPGGKRVSYRSRKGAEDYEKTIADAGAIPGFSFGQDPCQTIFRKFFTVFKESIFPAPKVSKTPSGGNVCVTLTPDMPGWPSDTPESTSGSGPRYIVAKTDAMSLQLLDPISLEPLAISSYHNIDPRLDGQMSAAHSCRDRQTGEFFNFTLKIGGRYGVYKVFRISKINKIDILATIDDAPASYIHSFAMTQKYVILTVWQAHITNYGLSMPYNRNIAQSIDKNWDPKKETVFYVIDRKDGGLVAKYKTPPFYCFHHLNAYDDPATGDIIIDMSIYPDNSIIDLLYLEKMRNAKTPGLTGSARRFRLHDVTASPEVRDALVDFTISATQSIELPVIKPELFHKPYRFAYGVSTAGSSFLDRIIKLDMANPNGPHRTWGAGGSYTAGEPIFVSRPSALAEDDGVLLSVVLDVDRQRSMLVVLNARDMTELARAQMEQPFPLGFHGSWSGNKSSL